MEAGLELEQKEAEEILMPLIKARAKMKIIRNTQEFRIVFLRKFAFVISSLKEHAASAGVTIQEEDITKIELLKEDCSSFFIDTVFNDLFPTTEKKIVSDFFTSIVGCVVKDEILIHHAVRSCLEYTSEQLQDINYLKYMRIAFDLSAKKQRLSGAVFNIAKLLGHKGIGLGLPELISNIFFENIDNPEQIFLKLKHAFVRRNIERKRKHMEAKQKITVMQKKAVIQDIAQFYENTRSQPREIIFYSGPTNSGKTYEALQEFKKASSGLYLSPIRCLAREIFDTISSENTPISLVTGEEQIIKDNAKHLSATVEVADLQATYDICVIDEIQNLADIQRGSAWSRALMGIRSQKIIVVGSSDAKKCVQNIAKKCGDIFKEKTFDRLCPLEETKDGVDGIIYFDMVQKGDAIIAFSRNNVFSLKHEVENLGYKASIIYDSLPLAVKNEQAKLFNNGDTDILIATEAIAYGFNLSIKRVLFVDVCEFNKKPGKFTNASRTLFRQIIGRAGRFGLHEKGEYGYLVFTKKYNPNLSLSSSYPFGYLDRRVKEYKKWRDDSLQVKHSPFSYVYFFPELSHLLSFSALIPDGTSMVKVLEKYSAHFKDLDHFFRLKNLDNETLNAEVLDSIQGLTFSEKYFFMFAPTKNSTHLSLNLLKQIVRAYAQRKPLPSFQSFHHMGNITSNALPKNLENLERLAHYVSLYCWLSRFFSNSENVQAEALMFSNQIADLINEIIKLNKPNFKPKFKPKKLKKLNKPIEINIKK